MVSFHSKQTRKQTSDPSPGDALLSKGLQPPEPAGTESDVAQAVQLFNSGKHAEGLQLSGCLGPSTSSQFLHCTVGLNKSEVGELLGGCARG